MPTTFLILFTSNLSSTFSEQEKPRSLLQKGISYCLQQIFQKNPFEYVNILTQETDLCQFTRDLKALTSSLSRLNDLPSSVNTTTTENLRDGLKRANDNAWKRWRNVIAPLVMQLIIFVDVDHSNILWTNFGEFVLPTKVHIIAFGSKFRPNSLEYKQQQVNIEILERLSSSFGGSFTLLRPDDPLRFLKEKFDQIVDREYKEYKGNLTVGHLTTEITLYPSPTDFCWRCITLKYHDNNLPDRFPTLISVLGFIPVNSVGSPPEICRFIVLPFESLTLCSSVSSGSLPSLKDPLCIMLHEVLKTHELAAIVQLEPKANWYGVLFHNSERITIVETLQRKKRKRRKTSQAHSEKISNSVTSLPIPIIENQQNLSSVPSDQPITSLVSTEESIGIDSKLISTESTSNITSENENPNFNNLNNNNINYNNQSAPISEEIIEEVEQEKEIERHGLVLSVFPKNIFIEWLGNFEHLAIQPIESLSETNKENTNLSLELENEIPLKGKKKPSYDVFSKGSYKVPSISEDSIQNDFQKLAKILKSLPQKTSALFNECEKLRRKAHLFALPGLIDALLEFLQHSMESFEQGSKEQTILSDLIKQLQARDVPLSSEEKEKTQRPLKMSVSNLIS